MPRPNPRLGSRDVSFVEDSSTLETIEGVKYDVASFMNWLRSLPPETSFQTNDPCFCPLGTYLNNPCANKRKYGFYSSNPGLPYDPPALQAFALLVDAEPTPTVSASRCIELLDQAMTTPREQPPCKKKTSKPTE